MVKTITEPAREINVRKETDVLVIGGGAFRYYGCTGSCRRWIECNAGRKPQFCGRQYDHRSSYPWLPRTKKETRSSKASRKN